MLPAIATLYDAVFMTFPAVLPRNTASDGAHVTCDGRLFQKLAPETGNACFQTVERLNDGIAS